MTAIPTPQEATSLRVCPQCGTETHGLICKKDGFATVERGRHFSRAAADRVGVTLNQRWRLDEVIRIDLLAVVYRAWDARLDREVAVRVLAAEIGTTLDRIARFQREGRFLASLAHPNIVQVYEHGVTNDGTLYIAEEMIRGESLAAAIVRGPLPAKEVVAVGRELFDALAEAHAHGVQHRSLSLANLWRVPRGDDATLKVDGFGWVRVLADEHQGFTYPRELAHAHATMAPEQARGRGVSGHADLYSAGAILYALLTGAPPFGDGSPSDLLVAHAVKMPRVPERDGQPLAGPLVDLILRCLEKKPWNRPDGGSAALELLEGAARRPLTNNEAGVTVLTPLPAPKAPPQATVELRAERSALPVSVGTGATPMVVKTITPSPRIEVPVVVAEPSPAPIEAAKPENTRWGIWVAALCFAAAAGVIVGMISSDEPAHTTARSIPSVSAPPAPTLAAAPAPEPERVVAPAPVAEDVTSPTPPPEPERVVAPIPPPEPVKEPVKVEVEAKKPEPIEVAKAEPVKVVKGTPSHKAEHGKKDPFADLEDPTVKPVAENPAITHRTLVDSEPPGASVMVDGRAVGATPIYIEWDEVGRPVAVRVAKPGFKPALATLGNKTGKSVFLTLQPADGL